MNDCSCNSCQNACKYKPGWFKPGEAEKAAELKGLPLEKFFKDHLAVDWWESDPDIFLLAPATDLSGTGIEYPSNPKGKCVFYKKGKCSIHEAKPFECREYHHTEKDLNGRHEKIAMTWKRHQKQISDLLGWEPVAAQYSFYQSLNW